MHSVAARPNALGALTSKLKSLQTSCTIVSTILSLKRQMQRLFPLSSPPLLLLISCTYFVAFAYIRIDAATCLLRLYLS